MYITKCIPLLIGSNSIDYNKFVYAFPIFTSLVSVYQEFCKENRKYALTDNEGKNVKTL